MKTLKRVISSTALLLIIGFNFAVSTPSKAVNNAFEDDYVTICQYNNHGELTGFNCINNGKKACGGCSGIVPVEN